MQSKRRIAQKYMKMMKIIEQEFADVEPIPYQVMELYKLLSLIYHGKIEVFATLYGWLPLDEGSIERAKIKLLGTHLTRFEKEVVEFFNAKCSQERPSLSSPS